MKCILRRMLYSIPLIVLLFFAQPFSVAATAFLAPATVIAAALSAASKIGSMALASGMSGADPTGEAITQIRSMVIRNQQQLLEVRSHMLAIENLVLLIQKRMDDIPSVVQRAVRDEMDIGITERFIGTLGTAHEIVLGQEHGLYIVGSSSEIVRDIQNTRNWLRQQPAAIAAPAVIALWPYERDLRADLWNLAEEERAGSLEELRRHLEVDVYVPLLVDLWTRLEHGESRQPADQERWGGLVGGGHGCRPSSDDAVQGLRYWHGLERTLGYFLESHLIELELWQGSQSAFYPASGESRPALCEGTWVSCAGTGSTGSVSGVFRVLSERPKEVIREQCPRMEHSVITYDWYKEGTIAVCKAASRSDVDNVTREIVSGDYGVPIELIGGEVGMQKKVGGSHAEHCLLRYKAAKTLALLIESYQNAIVRLVNDIRQRRPEVAKLPVPWDYDRDGYKVRGTALHSLEYPRPEQEGLVNFCGGMALDECWYAIYEPFVVWSNMKASAWEYVYECYGVYQYSNTPFYSPESYGNPSVDAAQGALPRCEETEMLGWKQVKCRGPCDGEVRAKRFGVQRKFEMLRERSHFISKDKRGRWWLN